MIKHLSALATLALATAGLVGTATTAHADNVELRIATLAPDGSDWMKEFDKAASEVKEKTSGRVVLKYFAGGQQGDERDYVRKIKLGQLDGAGVTSIGLSLIDESIRVLELPRMFNTVEEVDYVADKMWPYFQKKFEAKGFKLNDRGEVGWIYVISKDKLTTMAQIQGAKIWQWGDDAIIGAMFKKLGLKGQPLGVPEVEGSLTSGRINAAYGSPYAAVALQWSSKIGFISSMPISFAIGATVISLEASKKLSAEDTKTVASIGTASAKKLRKVIRKANDAAQKSMTKRGVVTVEMPKETVDAFDKAAAEIQTELAGKVYSKEELGMVIKYRAEFRAKK